MNYQEINGVKEENIEGQNILQLRIHGHYQVKSFQPDTDHSRGAQIESLSATGTVMTPGSNETKIYQTPTPSRQAHRGMGGRCALKELGGQLDLQPWR